MREELLDVCRGLAAAFVELSDELGTLIAGVGEQRVGLGAGGGAEAFVVAFAGLDDLLDVGVGVGTNRRRSSVGLGASDIDVVVAFLPRPSRRLLDFPTDAYRILLDLMTGDRRVLLGVLEHGLGGVLGALAGLLGGDANRIHDAQRLVSQEAGDRRLVDRGVAARRYRVASLALGKLLDQRTVALAELGEFVGHRICEGLHFGGVIASAGQPKSLPRRNSDQLVVLVHCLLLRCFPDLVCGGQLPE